MWTYLMPLNCTLLWWALLCYVFPHDNNNRVSVRQFQRSEHVWRKAVRRPTAGGRAGDPGQMLPVVVSAISQRTESADTSMGRTAKPASAFPTTPCTQGQQRQADHTHMWPIPRWAWASKPPRRQRLITKPFPLLLPAFRNTDVTDKSRHRLGSICQQRHCFSLSQWDNLKATHPTWLPWNVFRVLATDERKCQALIILMVTHLFSW